MSSIQTSIQLQDKMSAVLNRITGSMNIMRDTFEVTKSTMDRALGTASWEATRQSIANTSIAVAEYREELAKASAINMPKKSMTPQAGNMELKPPDMVSGFSLAGSELEVIARSIARVKGEQDLLTQSIKRMDFNVVSIGCSRLDRNVKTVGQNIKKNVAAQDQFNQSVKSGENAYNGLMGKVSRLAKALGIKDAMKKITSEIFSSAVELEATQAKYNAVFYGMTNVSDQFIKEFQSLTPATTAEARSMATGIQSLLIPMGMQRAEATAMTGDYMRLVGALTNYNSTTRTAGDVSSAFQSALSGEYDSLKSLGIQVNDTIVKQQAVEMGLASSTDAVSKAAKAQALLELAYQQSGTALTAYNETSLNTATRMQIMQKGFKDAFADAGQYLLPRVNQLLQSIQRNMPQIEVLIFNIVGVLNIMGMVLDVIINAVGSVVAFIQNNWPMIAPIIWGIVAVLIVYSATMGIAWLSTLKAAAALAWKTICTWAGAAAVQAMTIAQTGLNIALLNCPLTWIIIALIAIIAIFYAGVAAVNHFAGTSMSATGLICGAFATAGAFIINIFIGLWNGIVGIVVEVSNVFISFAEFFANFLNDPVSSIVRLIADMANFILGVLESLAKAIDTVFGSNLSGIVSGWSASIDSLKAELTTDSTITYDRVDKSKYQKEGIEYSDAWNGGNEFGEGFAGKLEDLFKMEKMTPIDNGASGGSDDMANQWQNIAGNTGDTAGNTARMADSMDMAEEELKSMRDMAEQEVINRFTTAELTVNMGGITNQVNSTMDLDGIGQYLDNAIFETLEVAAEGEHI